MEKYDFAPQIKSDESLELWMVRHGETIFNVKGIVQGWSDSPLTKNGKIMSACLGKGFCESKIDFEAIYSSDLTRCLDTANILADFLDGNLKVKSNKNLREINTGDGEGDLIEEHLKKYPFSLNFKKHQGTPNGEKWDDVYNRMIPTLYEICQSHSGQSKQSKILIVSHSMVISSIIAYLDDTVEEVIPIPNNSVTIFSYKEKKLCLKEHSIGKYIEMGLSFQKDIEKHLGII